MKKEKDPERNKKATPAFLSIGGMESIVQVKDNLR